MYQWTNDASSASSPISDEKIRIALPNEISGLLHWQAAFAQERKDHRFCELIGDTLKDGFEYGYLITETGCTVCAIQPCLLVNQDLMAGIGRHARKLIATIRCLWPRFMCARTFMVGCAAGEGHLDGNELSQFATAELLARSLPRLARELNCALAVLKEFPVKYRPPLQSLRHAGFTRVPSMPMTTLSIDYKDFDDYLSSTVSPRTRANIRRKLRNAALAQSAISMSVVVDATALADEIYPLYENVFERSSLQFEKLTKEFFCEIERRIPDKVRFLIWRQNGKIVAFALCMVQDDNILRQTDVSISSATLAIRSRAKAA